MSAKSAMRATLFTPLMKGKTRFRVRSDEMGACRLARDMVRTGTWWARMGGGGGRVGKSLRLMVLESSVHNVSDVCPEIRH